MSSPKAFAIEYVKVFTEPESQINPVQAIDKNGIIVVYSI